MSPDSLAAPGASKRQQAARFVLALLLTGLGLWTLHRYLPALIWASILAIAVWPMFQRALRRWPPSQHNVLLPSVFTVLIGLVFVIPFVLVAYQASKEVRGIYETIDQARSEGIPPPQWLSSSAPAIATIERAALTSIRLRQMLARAFVDPRSARS